MCSIWTTRSTSSVGRRGRIGGIRLFEEGDLDSVFSSFGLDGFPIDLILVSGFSHAAEEFVQAVREFPQAV